MLSVVVSGSGDPGFGRGAAVHRRGGPPDRPEEVDEEGPGLDLRFVGDPVDAQRDVFRAHLTSILTTDGCMPGARRFERMRAGARGTEVVLMGGESFTGAPLDGVLRVAVFGE